MARDPARQVEERDLGGPTIVEPDAEIPEDRQAAAVNEGGVYPQGTP